MMSLATDVSPKIRPKAMIRPNFPIFRMFQSDEPTLFTSLGRNGSEIAVDFVQKP